MTRKHDRETSCRIEVETWELEKIERVANDFDVEDREELAAELRRKLLDLKRNLPPDIRDWQKYLNKFLYNKASNWVRDWRLRAGKHLPLASSESTDDVESLPLESLLASAEESPEEIVAFAEVWDDMDPQLKELWEVLAEEGGSQIKAAERLGKHRNTVKAWIKRIKELLSKHGF